MVSINVQKNNYRLHLIHSCLFKQKTEKFLKHLNHKINLIIFYNIKNRHYYRVKGVRYYNISICS